MLSSYIFDFIVSQFYKSYKMNLIFIPSKNTFYQQAYFMFLSIILYYINPNSCIKINYKKSLILNSLKYFNKKQMLKQQPSLSALRENSSPNLIKNGLLPGSSNNPAIKHGQPVGSPRTQYQNEPSSGYQQTNYRSNRPSIFGIKQYTSHQKSFQESSRKDRPSVSPIRNPQIHTGITANPIQNKNSQNRLIIQNGHPITQVHSILRYGSQNSYVQVTPNRLDKNYAQNYEHENVQMKHSNISNTNNSNVRTSSYHQPKTPNRCQPRNFQNIQNIQNMHLNKQNRVMHVNSPSQLVHAKNFDQKIYYRPVSNQNMNGFFFPGYQPKHTSQSPYIAKNTQNYKRTNHQIAQQQSRKTRNVLDRNKSQYIPNEKVEQYSSTMEVSEIQDISPQRNEKAKKSQCEISLSPEKSCIGCSSYAHYKSATTCKYYCAQCAIQQMVKGVKLIQKPKNKKPLQRVNNRKQVGVQVKMSKEQDKKIIQQQLNGRVTQKVCNQKQFRENTQQTKLLSQFITQVHQQKVEAVQRQLQSLKVPNQIPYTQSVEMKVSNQENHKSRESKQSSENSRQQGHIQIRSSLPFPSRQQQITTFLANINNQHKKIEEFLQNSVNPYEKKVKQNFSTRRDQLFAHYQKIQQVLKQSLQLDLQYLQKEQTHIFQIQKIEKQRLQKDLRKLEGIKQDIQPNIQKIIQKVEDAKYKEFMLKYNSQYNKIHVFRTSAQLQGNYSEVEIGQESCYRKQLYQPLIFRIYGGYYKNENVEKQCKGEESKIQERLYQSIVKRSKGRSQQNDLFFSFQKKRKSKGNMEQ